MRLVSPVGKHDSQARGMKLDPHGLKEQHTSWNVQETPDPVEACSLPSSAAPLPQFEPRSIWDPVHAAPHSGARCDWSGALAIEHSGLVQQVSARLDAYTSAAAAIEVGATRVTQADAIVPGTAAGAFAACAAPFSACASAPSAGARAAVTARALDQATPPAGGELGRLNEGSPGVRRR